MGPKQVFVFLVLVSCITGHDYVVNMNRPNCKYHGDAYFGMPHVIGNVPEVNINISASDLTSSMAYEDVLYIVNDDDGSNPNVIYAISADDATIIGSINVTNINPVDIEAVCSAPCPMGMGHSCLYLHDAGSSGEGPAHAIYIVPEECDPATHVSKPAAQIINYSLQPGNEGMASNTIFVGCNREIYFFDMAYRGYGTRLYQIKYIDGVPTAVGTFQMDLPTTNNGPKSTSLSTDCCELLIKMEDRVYYLPFDENDGTVDKARLQVLPCMPNRAEEGIAWNRRCNGYWIISEDGPAILKFAQRDTSVPESIFGFGKCLGFLDEVGQDVFTNIGGIATSKEHKNAIYAAPDNDGGPNSFLIVQACNAQSIGKVAVSGYSFNSRNDLSTGPCVAGPGNCIYTNEGGKGSEIQPRHEIIFFREPQYLFATSNVTLDEENILRYSIPDNATTHAMMIGCDEKIYVMTYVDVGANFKVYRLEVKTGNEYSAVEIADLPNPSRVSGPEAADISPCCDEILIKFDDTVLYYNLVDDDVTVALRGSPILLPYIPEHDGSALAFGSDCDSYYTVSHDNQEAPLKVYERLHCCDAPTVH